MFLSWIFINKVLPITKAVANYDDYPVKFYKAKSKLYRISLAAKRNNMSTRIIAAFDCWFCHVLLKWYCTSLLLLSRLTRVTKKNCKKRRSESETESATELVEKWLPNGSPERLGYWILESSFMSWMKTQRKTESDYVYCPVVWKLLHHAFHDCLPQNFDWFVQSTKVLY